MLGTGPPPALPPGSVRPSEEGNGGMVTAPEQSQMPQSSPCRPGPSPFALVPDTSAQSHSVGRKCENALSPPGGRRKGGLRGKQTRAWPTGLRWLPCGSGQVLAFSIPLCAHHTPSSGASKGGLPEEPSQPPQRRPPTSTPQRQNDPSPISAGSGPGYRLSSQGQGWPKT